MGGVVFAVANDTPTIFSFAGSLQLQKMNDADADNNDLVDQFLKVKSWRSGGIRAPHKPLLMLYSLAQFSRGNEELTFAEVEGEVKNLLRDFGPNRQAYRAEYPFWRLQNDNLWCVSTEKPIIENSRGDTSRRNLLAVNAKGAFSKSIIKKFHDDPNVVKAVVLSLLVQNFPSTMHEDILQAIGYSLAESSHTHPHRIRSRSFREKVLRAYEYRCAICGFDVRMDNSTIALEAAHIKWHQANGDETANNGLALCALHHKLFDRGAFTLSTKFEILVSDRAHGTQGFSEWLMNYHGKKVFPPQNKNLYPHNENILWHTTEVFQGYVRGPFNR